MDFSWIADISIWIGLLTLIVLEVVLGIDNLVFVAILSDKLPPHQRDHGRIIGLSLALIIRIGMLAGVSWLITLQTPLIQMMGFEFSGKDLIMLAGGIFLLYKATMELHERLEGVDVHLSRNHPNKKYSSFPAVVAQILVLDAVFSIDSVITAVAMVEHVQVAMLAVCIAMGAMIWASKPLTTFVNAHPTIIMLCLGFLLMIGFSLLAEGFHFKIPKGYLYAAIGFSILIEVFNQVSQANRKKNFAISHSWRSRTADAVLGMMGVREAVLAKEGPDSNSFDDDDFEHFETNEKQMIRSVLTLAERPIMGLMVPRRDIERLDISQTKEQQKQQLQQTPYSRLIVVGKAGIDEPLGFISKKDLFAQLLDQDELNINLAIRQPLILPESTTALDAMELFRKHSADMALVVDEFGSILGLLTIKDLLETIAGEFPEEHEREEGILSIQENPDQSLTVDGSLDLATLEQELGLKSVEEEVDYHTVAGLMIEELECIPDVGDAIDYQGWHFEVIEKNEQRIERVRIRAINHPQ